MTSSAIRRPLLHCALFVLLLFALSVPAAQAQTALYGQFSASHFNLPNTNDWGYGAASASTPTSSRFHSARLGATSAFSTPALPAKLTSSAPSWGPASQCT